MSTVTRRTLSARTYVSGVLVAGLLALSALAACDAADRSPSAPTDGDARLQRLPVAADDTAASPQATSVGSDPSGDTIGTGSVEPDLTALSVRPDGTVLVFTLDFARDLPRPVVGLSPTLTGLLELDLDNDPATGRGAFIDILHRFFGRGAAAGLGVDAAIGLAPLDADFTAPVYDAADRVIGRVKPVFGARRITIRVPRALLANNAGRLGATVLIGNGAEATDFAPSDGHFTFGAAR